MTNHVNGLPIRCTFCSPAPMPSWCRMPVAACLLISCLITSVNGDDRQIRVAAEWEPAIGVMISWPLVIPDQLVIDLARQEKLFVALKDAADRTAAEQKFTALGITDSRIHFFVGDPEAEPDGQKTPRVDADNGKPGTANTESSDTAEEDIYQNMQNWTRDWGPFAGFDENGTYYLIDPLFADYPMSKIECDAKLNYFPGARTEDWNGDEIKSLASLLQVDVLKVPVYLTGGNVMFDGNGSAMSTCITLNENKQFGVSRDRFFNTARESLGIDSYHVISNFEDYGIQHIDCFLKFLDDERVLIARPPPGHESYGRYQDLVAEIAKLKNRAGRPYRILRIDAGEVVNESMDDPQFKQWLESESGVGVARMKKGIAAYTNSLILNKRIFVPLYGIATDNAALQTWRAVMPGYEVTGYEFSKRTGSKIPWQSFDALHCRTRAIWDPQMLHISHDRIPQIMAFSPTGYQIEASVIDYSRAGIVDDSVRVSWRRQGDCDWNSHIMQTTDREAVFSAVIAAGQPGANIEYFVSATDLSGRSQTLPPTAPMNFYSFAIGGGKTQ